MCPKCGGCLGRPRYCDGLGLCAHRVSNSACGCIDHLVHTCKTCGYQAVSKTNDAKAVPIAHAPQEEQ